MSDSAAEAAYGWFGYFQIFVLSALQIVGAAVSPDVQVSVYAHFVEPEVAGPNFRTTVANIEGHVGKELTIVVNLREAFKTGDFPALIPAKKVVHEGFEMGEKLTTWTNYFHRFRIAQVGRTIASMNPMLLSVFHYKDVTVYPLGQLSRYMVQFLFYRGSQRWMLAKSSVASSISIYATNVDRLTIDLNTFIGGDNGMHNIIEGKVLEPVEVPYYCRYPLWSDQFTQEYLQEAAAASTEDTAPHVAFTPGFTSADTSTYDVYVALGDDWSSGWLLPPMCLTDASANANALKRSMKSVSVATDANKPAPFEKASSKSAVLLTTSSARRVVDLDNNNNSVSREKRLLNRKM